MIPSDNTNKSLRQCQHTIQQPKTSAVKSKVWECPFLLEGREVKPTGRSCQL